ncbi:hypothetical protein A2619_04390 [candidate division WWE3 bacterium RIFOXYD1_FULL_39_9]|uniref:Uncharacterized protein n=1 Tax=candidate division WWE3 bacterium RIFOXYD1_FULL_39_9 TaxID=1802649 RepID=A0A1F4X6I1_UNCKA|nr:MAG: hypothetical protein A2619_04390 [candidate division WWE3 bacterium RIFOXYD1_FULL_39_9]
MNTEIYSQIANEEPIEKIGNIHRYKAGWIVWDEKFMSFKGPFDTYPLVEEYNEVEKKFYNKSRPKSIQQWVEEKIEEKLANKHLASKGYVQAAITERITGKQTVSYVEDDKKEAMNLSEKIKWAVVEEACLRSGLNHFIQETSKTLGRSSASIKAKIFRMLQQSYQKV